MLKTWYVRKNAIHQYGIIRIDKGWQITPLWSTDRSYNKRLLYSFWVKIPSVTFTLQNLQFITGIFLRYNKV